ncbi:YitT family protein [Aerococcus sp. HMSC10H05]|uniref:YczE/YyaS/YitT family protein n=1 Tax=Aerococcus sp. HMSC10H05 TaxID=1581084 RepID=UPI001FEE8D49|nr:hypothetical protein [Aerococcus sp. HMSC10H05]
MHKWTVDLLIRALIAFIGCVGIALGVSISGVMDMGMDPFAALWMAVSDFVPIGFGNIVFIVNLIIFTIAFFIDRSKFGLGTFINWVFCGYMIQYFTYYFTQIIGLGTDDMNLLIRVILTLVGGTVFLLGAAFYMSAGLGVAPLDAIAPILEEKTPLSFAQGRFLHEVICLILAFILGGPVGVMTLYLGFFAGPMLALFRSKLTEPFVRKVTREGIRD